MPCSVGYYEDADFERTDRWTSVTHHHAHPQPPMIIFLFAWPTQPPKHNAHLQRIKTYHRNNSGGISASTKRNYNFNKKFRAKWLTRNAHGLIGTNGMDVAHVSFVSGSRTAAAVPVCLQSTQLILQLIQSFPCFVDLRWRSVGMSFCILHQTMAVGLKFSQQYSQMIQNDADGNVNQFFLCTAISDVTLLHQR